MEEKERFEEAKRLYKDANADQRYVLERIFPQLRESEDEKIRKAIINYFECQIRDEPTRKNILNKWINWLKFIKASSINNMDKSFIDDIKNIIYEAPGVLQADKNRLVAWLEKQGESKSIDIQSIEKRAHEVFPDDDDENTPLYRQAFIDGAVDYIDCGCKNIAWSEEDEEMFDKIIDYMKPMPIFFESTKGKSGKEYTKEFIKGAINWLKSLKERVQPQSKQEWKQENTSDLTDFENAMMHIGDSFFGQHASLDPNSTNAIKEQANLLLELIPSKEWSEKDEEMFDYALNMIEWYSGKIKNNKLRLVSDWLKSLKPQNRWKPSDEQMQELHNVFNDTSASWEDSVIESLYNDLKKLREE